MKENTVEPTIELRDEERTRCEVWTRVMGYHRPVSAFNRGKQAEHQERTYFQERPAGRPDARQSVDQRSHPHFAETHSEERCCEDTQREAA
ncbi:anaerobic ribonucleoside-triphosphate reductase [Halochromatium salexigens]|uniref:Uncharacterized protein n=1 Tax=Halochromatium salexigens TaxID=49447 RepID=A0AAJ0UGU7_HALSE|nr:anaerobic ribonucleoside-triphosphate reductase [Halochromatium salexigens]MBK5931212.1 hypothetical protein [Halochromatium salexigens]